MSTEAKKKEPGLMMLVVVLAAICIVMAALLGMFNGVTKPLIDANTEKKTAEALENVLPADAYEQLEYTGDNALVSAVYKAGDEGYVIQTEPSGFSGAITMMTGITNDGVVSGIAIINHAETSGLGANATKPEWQEQFKGAEGEVKVTKDGGEIISITGSTITSRAVCVGVNAARETVAAIME